MEHINFCDQNHQNWYEHIISCDPQSEHNSKHIFDIYSFTHIFWAMLSMFILRNIFKSKIVIFIILFILFTIFEIHENLPKQIIKYNRVETDNHGKSSYRGDSTINIMGDILSNTLGLIAGYSLNTKDVSVILFLLVNIITKVLGTDYWIEFYRYALLSIK